MWRRKQAKIKIMNTNSKSEEGRTAPTCSRTTTNAIKKARRDLDKYDREQRRKLMAEHGIQMMHKVDDLEEECLRTTGHAYYDRPLCMSVRLSRLPGKSSVIRECRWCHAVDFDENRENDHPPR